MNREKGNLRSQNLECLLEGEMFRQNPGVTGPSGSTPMPAGKGACVVGKSRRNSAQRAKL